MTTNFPNGLDAFLNPSGTTNLDENTSRKHSVQHQNINDAMFAVQSHVGITGSTIPGTVNFRIDDIDHGHDHDGINSRQIKLGPTGSSLPYSSGVFGFTNFTPIGEAISDINVYLKQLSGSIGSSSLSSSNIAFESQGLELTPSAVRVDFTGSGVSGTLSSSGGGDKVTYTIPGIDIRQILFLAEFGPFEGFSLSPMYKENVYTGSNNYLLSSSTWYTDNLKTKKIFEIEYTNRNSRNQSEKMTYRVFNEDGISLKTKVEDIITYNGIREISRTRTVI